MKPADAKPADAPCLSQLLQLLDRPIAFHRCFVTLTGSVTAALMLSQALYWQRRCKEPEGWWYKTLEEWTEETGLNRRETEAARIKRISGSEIACNLAHRAITQFRRRFA